MNYSEKLMKRMFCWFSSLLNSAHEETSAGGYNPPDRGQYVVRGNVYQEAFENKVFILVYAPC